MQAHNAIGTEAADAEAQREALAERDATANNVARDSKNGIDIQFLSNLAHQLRSPLSSLRVWVDLLNDPAALASPDDMKRLVEGIDRATSRLERQISDVLEAGYLQAGTLSIETGLVDATEQLALAVSEAEHAARSRRIKIDIKFGDRPAIVTASAPRLKQIIGCLFSNAIRFSPVDGTITVATGSNSRIAGDPATTTILEPQFEGRSHYICVSDSGPGITPELHASVFRPFYRATRKDAHGGGGSGLGLAIALGLLKLHKGGMWLKSGLNEGAEFEVSLPQAGQKASLN